MASQHRRDAQAPAAGNARFFELVDVAALVDALEVNFGTYRDRAEAVDAALHDRAAALEQARRAYRDVVDAIARLESPTAAQRGVTCSRACRASTPTRPRRVPPMLAPRRARLALSQPVLWPEPLAHRRVGLDRSCMRVVMLTCLVQQMLGEAEPPVFEPGVLRPSIVRDVARTERDRERARLWRCASRSDRHRGRRVRARRADHHRAASNHVEDDVFGIAPLSDWSIQDVQTVFHASRPLCPRARPPDAARSRPHGRQTGRALRRLDIAAMKLFIPLFAPFARGWASAPHARALATPCAPSRPFASGARARPARAARPPRAVPALQADVRQGHLALEEFLGRLKASDPAARGLVRFKRVGSVERLDVATLLPLLGACLRRALRFLRRRACRDKPRGWSVEGTDTPPSPTCRSATPT